MIIANHILLADMNGLEKGGLICSIVFGAIGCIVAVVALLKKTDTVISPQPLPVMIVDEMHKRFAEKTVFEEHVKTNTSRHSQLFNQLDEVEEKSRALIESKVAEINEDRRRTMERLDAKFDQLGRDMRDMPGKIVVDVLNAQKVGRRE